MNQTLFQINLDSHISSARKFRGHLQKALFNVVTESSVKNKVLLVLSEAVNNINKHNDELGVTITVKFGKNDSGFWLKILDDAPAFNPLLVEAVKLDDDFPLLENQRGIYLIKQECDDVKYQFLEKSRLNSLSCFWEHQSKAHKNKILIIEDSQYELAVLEHQLSEEYDVITCENPVVASQLIEKHEISLILCDLHMPRITGIDLYIYLQKNRKEVIPFIFITGSDEPEMLEQAYHLGVDDVLCKPVPKTILLNTVKRVLQRTRHMHRRLQDRIDKKISESLLPSIPEHLKAWNIAVGYRNTGKGGGDFLLHQPSTHGDTIVLVDIMGHDDSAKFFSFAYAGYIRGLLYNNYLLDNPDELLLTLSNMALNDELLSRINLTCCVLQMGQGRELKYASAGHPEGLLITADGSKPIAQSGIIPGVIPNAAYKVATFSLPKSGRIALFTDGFFESGFDTSSRKALKELMLSTLQKTIHLDVQASMDEVLYQFDKFTQERPLDDLVLCLIDLGETQDPLS